MNGDRYLFRNSGVACLVKGCGFCESATEHAINFVLDVERKKQCLLGCCECGRTKGLSEGLYDELYELSFEYDAWKAGELSFEAFREQVPESLRDVALDDGQELELAQWICPKCREPSPMNFCKCWNCGYENREIESTTGSEAEELGDAEGEGLFAVENAEEESEGEVGELGETEVAAEPVVTVAKTVKRRRPEFVRLSNGRMAPLGMGLAMGGVLAVAFMGVSFFVQLPGVVELATDDWDLVEAADRLEPLLSAAVVFGLTALVGYWLSRGRFPERVSVSDRGVEVFPRGGGKSRVYGLELVREARFAEEGKYLTLRLADGKVFVVEMGEATCGDLRWFFRGR